LLSAAHVAVSEQVPEPLVIVTLVPAFVHAPLDMITAVVLAFVFEETAKLPP
jgi:hypothetical protein